MTGLHKLPAKTFRKKGAGTTTNLSTLVKKKALLKVEKLTSFHLFLCMTSTDMTSKD